MCAWPALPGHTLCGNHVPKDGRVPCPLDGRHTVLAADLASHLRVCNAARDAAAALSARHIQPGCNGGGESDDDDGEAAEAEALALWQCREGDAALAAARAAVRAVADVLLASAAATEPLPEPASEPACVTAALDASRAAAAAPHATTPFEPRHATQQAGILAQMAAAGLLPPPSGGDVVYAELGAGRGYLTHLLAEAYVQGSDAAASFLLVERRAYRNKAERSLRQHSVTRLRCDVADLDLAAAPLPPPTAGQQRERRRIVAIAKHLCGAGTDAALRCAACCSRTAATAEHELLGLAIAPCCHHACRWRVFCGKATLRRCGLGPLQFALASRMASWAVCPGDTSPSGDDAHAVPPSAADARWGLSVTERQAVGAAAKQLFDSARAEWATSHCGGTARLVSYCAVHVSPEHRLLVMRADE
jgi:tRNA:m4X modification enzyme